MIDWASWTIYTGGILFFLSITLGIVFRMRRKNESGYTVTSMDYSPPVDWEQRLQTVEEKYGTDARTIVYDQAFLKNFLQILNTYEGNSDHHYSNFSSDFEDRHLLNFPGPFYTTYTDTCGTGQIEAPENILFDEDCHEYVFRQPVTMKQLIGVYHAACIDPFGAYCLNGNDHWTLDLIKAWWKRKAEIIQLLSNEELKAQNDTQAQDYIDYLNGEAETDLRKYAYFLMHGTYPKESEIQELPEIY